MEKMQFRCIRCGHVFVVEVMDRDEAIRRGVPTSTVRCEKCGGPVERIG